MCIISSDFKSLKLQAKTWLRFSASQQTFLLCVTPQNPSNVRLLFFFVKLNFSNHTANVAQQAVPITQRSFWRRFLNTLLLPVFSPPPLSPPPSLRIIRPVPHLVSIAEITLSYLIRPRRPTILPEPCPVPNFKGHLSLWPVGMMLVELHWQKSRKIASPLPSFQTHTKKNKRTSSNSF